MYGQLCYHSKERGIMATFGIGSVIGEEWVFRRDLENREENCFAKNNACVLEIG